MRFLRGYICFTASDGFPERFLNLCNQAGVAVWDISWSSGTMHGRTDRRGFAAMSDCAAPAGIALAASCKCGLPFFLQKYRKRVGLLIGLVLCIATLRVLSGMVWVIEVQGNERVAAEDILEVMQQHGLYLGARRNSLDAREISEIVREQLPGISWISVNLRGSSAVIELKEELPLQPGGPTEPQDIIAAKAGQIRIFELYQGSAQTGLNQAVYPGAVLAGGQIQNLDETFRYVPAQAYVVARTAIAAEGLVPRQSTAMRLQQGRAHYTLRVLHFRIPLGPRPRQSGALELNTSFTWQLGERLMPLGLDRSSQVQLQEQQRIKNDRQLQLAAGEAFFDQLYVQLRAAQVLRQEVVIELLEEHCRVVMTGAAYENIGVARPLTGQ